MAKDKETVGFHLQIIPLQDAQNLELLGNGNYAEMKEAILEKIPTLQPMESFVFGLPPNGKTQDKKEIKGIYMALNATLRKAELPWSIKYSFTKKLFFALPIKLVPRKYTKASQASSGLMDINKFMETAQKVLGPCNSVGNKHKLREWRTAICKVGINQLNIRPRELAPFIGIGRSGVAFNAKHGKTTDSELKLMEAMKGVR